MAMKWESLGGGGDKGGRSNEKRRSLKLASHARQKAVMPQKWTVERLNGRRRKR
ncbi:acyl-CoA--sterol O-acyltransferase 1-like protein [Corchorus capsularis]|uniref:Acyl-CoA--sterol O-acyltransferase 1-like protein n=1 Tax=Corchorus capsularis TaxID=210143 RepID=A0A1R3IM42_COCAP|nr:acyl-CoA--sterol O-acyltransferase 1-like protein [Corchorus capsularis]